MPVPTISALPEAPSTSDPANFASEADAFVAALATLRTEFNAAAAYVDALLAGAANVGNATTLLNKNWASPDPIGVTAPQVVASTQTKASQGFFNSAITPSSWATFFPLEGKLGAAIAFATGQVDLVSNAYANSGWKYANSGSAVGRLEINVDVLTYAQAGSGTAGNTITFAERLRVNEYGIELGGTGTRSTTNPSNALNFFNGTAPVGTLTNGASLYAQTGELWGMDAAGNATIQTPHDKNTNEWIYDSLHTPTGKRLRVDMERLVRAVNDHFGWDFVHDTESV